MTSGFQRMTHEAEVPASAEAVYEVLADAATAPLVFPGTVHVEHLARSDTDERLRIWAADGDDARCWTSHRTLDGRRRCVTFRQEAPAAPMAAMQGEWWVEPLTGRRARIRLDHAYRAIDDDREALGWIEAMVDRVSNGQLAALQRFVTLGPPAGRGPQTLRRSATLDCPAELAYAAVHDATAWAGLPLVTGPVVVHRPRTDMQLVDLALRGPAGDVHPLRLARVGFPGSHIAFKVMAPPAPLVACTGRWQFGATPHGSQASVDHDVLVDHTSQDEIVSQLLGDLGQGILTRLAGLP